MTGFQIAVLLILALVVILAVVTMRQLGEAHDEKSNDLTEEERRELARVRSTELGRMIRATIQEHRNKR